MPRTLIVCCDGTGNYYNKEITNVVKLFAALDKSDPETQLCYYQPGIGTYASPDSVQSDLFEQIAKLGDLGFAWYLPAHIMSAYRFLMDNYCKGDKICLFGFSRGAYTVRCLAGMLHKVGLLPKANQEHIIFAYNLYINATPDGRKLAQGFRDTFSLRVDIDFVGVWDTVASVGLTFKTLPFTDSNTIIRTFRHAMSLDEHRVKFLPNPWKTPPKHPLPPPVKPSPLWHPFKWVKWFFRSRTLEDLNAGNVYDDDEIYHDNHKTDVKEVWFAGHHADVGGGSVPTETLHSLANPSFKWMINQIIAHTNIKFVGGMFDSTLPGSIRGFHASMSDRPALPSSFLQGPAQTSDSYHFEEPSTATTAVPPSTPPTTSKPFVKPTSPIVQQYKRQQTLEGPGSSHLLSVAQSDPVKDATAEKFDQLVKNPIWKILEYMLLWEYTQDPVTGVWSRRLRWHNGRPRTVPDLNPWFHSSVRIRMEEKGYLWAARLQDGATIRWADQDGIADGESVGEGEESFDEGSDRK